MITAYVIAAVVVIFFLAAAIDDLFIHPDNEYDSLR